MDRGSPAHAGMHRPSVHSRISMQDQPRASGDTPNAKMPAPYTERLAPTGGVSGVRVKTLLQARIAPA